MMLVHGPTTRIRALSLADGSSTVSTDPDTHAGTHQAMIAIRHPFGRLPLRRITFLLLFGTRAVGKPWRRDTDSSTRRVERVHRHLRRTETCHLTHETWLASPLFPHKAMSARRAPRCPLPKVLLQHGEVWSLGASVSQTP